MHAYLIHRKTGMKFSNIFMTFNLSEVTCINSWHGEFQQVCESSNYFRRYCSATRLSCYQQIKCNNFTLKCEEKLQKFIVKLHRFMQCCIRQLWAAKNQISQPHFNYFVNTFGLTWAIFIVPSLEANITLPITRSDFVALHGQTTRPPFAYLQYIDDRLMRP